MKVKMGRLIGQGRTAEVFEFGEEKILKLYRKSIPRKIIDMEYMVSRKLESLGLNVPKVYELIEYEDRTGIVFEKVQGVTMMKIIALRPWRLKRESKRLAELHYSIQKHISIEIPGFKQRMCENILRNDLLQNEVKNKICSYLDGLKDDTMLCHGDFHPDNILISKDKAVIIDWMTAATGDAAADVARTAVILKYGQLPENKSFIEKKLVNFVRNKFYSAYIKHYLAVSKIDPRNIEMWELPIAAARLIEAIPMEEKQVLIELINSKIEEMK